MLEHRVRLAVAEPGFEFTTDVDAAFGGIDANSGFKERRINVILLDLVGLLGQRQLEFLLRSGLDHRQQKLEASTVSGETLRRSETKLSAICSR